jgi:hypothetical protein
MSFAYSEGNPVEDQSRLHKPPLDTERLDRLMQEAGLDALDEGNTGREELMPTVC